MTGNRKRGGIQKEYEETETTFTKKGMWLERYHNEITGLSLASQHGILVPAVISHSSDGRSGTVTMQKVRGPRADQLLWEHAQPHLFREIGAILARIHELPVPSREVSLALLERRFQDLQSDVLRLSTLHPGVCNAATQTMQTIAWKILNRPAGEFTHGDFTIQNIFAEKDIIVYDWEHCGIGSSLYDIGVFASFMILLVTDGGWDFSDYYAALDKFLDGYSKSRTLSEEDLHIVDGLRFLGHRQIAQYYLFILEYLAKVEQIDAASEALDSEKNIEPETLNDRLCGFGVCFNQIWLHKVLSAIRRGGYRVSDSFWKWFKNEVKREREQ